MVAEARTGRLRVTIGAVLDARRKAGVFAWAEPTGLWRISATIQVCPREALMNGIIYLIGLVVVVMAVLSLIGLR
jgi:hypothetical protein